MSPRAAIVLVLVTAVVARADDIFDPKSKLKVEAERGVGGEGPAWHPELGVLMSGNGHINRLSPDGKSSVYRKDAGTNGLLFDAQGRLLACEPAQRRVTRTEPDGKVTVLADKYDGKRFTEPNDLTVDSKGRVYFSDPCYGDRSKIEMKDAKGQTIEGVYRIDPDGKVTRVIGREVERANGVLVSGNGRFLYVADNNNTKGGARKLWQFERKDDGSIELGTRKLIYDWGTGRGPDGLKEDEEGRLYVAGGLNKPNPPFEPATDVKGGIYVIDPIGGKLLAFLPVPTDEVTNCAFGGEDRKTLYITGGGVLYSIRTTTPGRVVFPPSK
jgi:gluconolactonase